MLVKGVTDVSDQTDFSTTFHDSTDSKNWGLAAGGHLDKQVFRNQTRKVSLFVKLYIKTKPHNDFTFYFIYLIFYVINISFIGPFDFPGISAYFCLMG